MDENFIWLRTKAAVTFFENQGQNNSSQNIQLPAQSKVWKLFLHKLLPNIATSVRNNEKPEEYCIRCVMNINCLKLQKCINKLKVQAILFGRAENMYASGYLS